MLSLGRGPLWMCPNCEKYPLRVDARDATQELSGLDTDGNPYIFQDTYYSCDHCKTLCSATKDFEVTVTLHVRRKLPQLLNSNEGAAERWAKDKFSPFSRYAQAYEIVSLEIDEVTSLTPGEVLRKEGEKSLDTTQKV